MVNLYGRVLNFIDLDFIWHIRMCTMKIASLGILIPSLGIEVNIYFMTKRGECS
jgi:hypothetical protein